MKLTGYFYDIENWVEMNVYVTKYQCRIFPLKAVATWSALYTQAAI